MEQVFGGFWFWAIWTDLFGQGISPRHLACLASVLVCIFYLNLRFFFNQSNRCTYFESRTFYKVHNGKHSSWPVLLAPGSSPDTSTLMDLNLILSLFPYFQVAW